MRILHITHTDVTNDSRIEKEIDALSSLPDSVIFCYFVVSGAYCKDRLRDDVMYLESHSIANRYLWINRSLRHIIKIIELSFDIIFKGLKVKADIVHVHDTLALPAATFLAAISGSKLIYDAHELESDKNGQSRFMSLGTYVLERLCWWKINGFVTVSDSIRDWYFQRFPSKQCQVILNSPSFYPPTQSILRSVLGISRNSLVVIYIGYLSKGRGIESALEAYSNLEINSDLVFLGSGDLESLIDSYASKYSNIHRHPPVAHDKVVEFASGADVGLCVIENVSQSDYLCLPNKLFEYAFSGLRVIGSDFPEISSVLRQFDLGITVDGSPRSIQEAVEKIPIKSTTSSEHLYPLSWNYQVKKLLDLYERL